MLPADCTRLRRRLTAISRSLERPGTEDGAETEAETLSAAPAAEPEAPAFVPPAVAAARHAPARLRASRTCSPGAPELAPKNRTGPPVAHDENDTINDKPMPLLDHLIELRRRLMWSIGTFFVAFLSAIISRARSTPFSRRPWRTSCAARASSRQLIYTALYEAFFTYMKVAFFGGAFISFPDRSPTQLWLFIAPGLYRSEKRAILPFLVATPVLFVMGAALAYYFVFPFAWQFFLSFETPTGARRHADRADGEGQRISRPGDEADLRLRHRLPAAGALTLLAQGRHRLVARG